MPDVIALHDGRILETHDPYECAGRPCCIHAPSDHHMRDWPLNWRGDRGLMERICPCGTGHPDPDHLGYVRETRSSASARVEGVHGCCGCCRFPAGATERA